MSHQLSKVVKQPGSFKCSDLPSFVFITSFIKQQFQSLHLDIMSNKEGKLSSRLEDHSLEGGCFLQRFLWRLDLKCHCFTGQFTDKRNGIVLGPVRPGTLSGWESASSETYSRLERRVATWTKLRFSYEGAKGGTDVNNNAPCLAY